MTEESFRCQIMSDLHLETHPSYCSYEITQTAPYLALLGDIGRVEKQDLFDFLERQLLRYRVVFYLLGNHEPHHLSWDSAKRKVRVFMDKVKKLREKSASIGEFVFLDQTRYDVTDRVTILGCTLFSRVSPSHAFAVQSRLVDFRDILHWDVGEHVDAHVDDLRWLNEQTARVSHEEPERKLVIFTHQSPCLDSRAVRSRHRNSEVISGFATDLSNEGCWKSSAVAMWAFGHTHFNCDFEDNLGKRVVANQKGYFLYPQGTFRAAKVFEISTKRLGESTSGS